MAKGKDKLSQEAIRQASNEVLQRLISNQNSHYYEFINAIISTKDFTVSSHEGLEMCLNTVKILMGMYKTKESKVRGYQ